MILLFIFCLCFVYVYLYSPILTQLASLAPPSGLLISGYVASIAGFYILVSGFLTKSSAALLNVSLLTADIYSLLFVVFAEHVVPGPLYFAGTVVVFAGVGLFNYYEQRVIESEGGSSEEARGEASLEQAPLRHHPSISKF